MPSAKSVPPNVQNPREVYGRTLVEMGRENPNIVVLEADLGRSTMTCYFEQAFPERFFEMGIAEANMTSFAAGLALAGKIPFTNSFAVFAAGRAFDQIRQGVSIPGLGVRIVGSSAGLSDFGDGSTHQSVEDVAIMRAIPNMTVLVPVDGIETRKMTRALAEYRGPAYMRLGRDDMPDLFPEDAPLVFGRPVVIREGRDIVVFANGIMVSRAVDAAVALEGRLSLRVVNVSTLKPVDEHALRAAAAGTRGAVTAEEHSVIGGLGSLVAEVFHSTPLPIASIGIQDRFGQSARTYAELLEAYGLTAGHIADAAVQVAGATGSGLSSTMTGPR
jgi:transketolase